MVRATSPHLSPSDHRVSRATGSVLEDSVTVTRATKRPAGASEAQ